MLGERSGGPVLVVEDEADLRQLLAGVLEGDGFRAVTARNGYEALHLLRDGAVHPCLILLDLMMPGMNGWSFLRQRRADPALADVPVVIVSAYGQNVDASQLGAVDLLAKP